MSFWKVVASPYYNLFFMGLAFGGIILAIWQKDLVWGVVNAVCLSGQSFWYGQKVRS